MSVTFVEPASAFVRAASTRDLRRGLSLASSRSSPSRFLGDLAHTLR